MAKVNRYKTRDLINMGLTIAIIVVVNVIGSFVFERFDLTSEKRYTLSSATEELVESLDDVVYIKVYLDDESTDLPAGFVRLKNSTRELIEELRALNKENIQYEFIDPNSTTDKKLREDLYRQLTKQGIQYTNLEVTEEGGKSEKIIFPGAILTYKGKEVPVQLLKSQIGVHPEVMLNNSVTQLEYEFASAIKSLTLEKELIIAFSEGHGELSELETQDISRELSSYYAVTRVKLNERLDALNNVNLLIIAKPDSAFSEKNKFVIDQFIMRGGRVMWLLDKTDASMDSLQNNSTTFALPKDVNLDDQLFRYGARVNTTLVQDLQAAPIPIIVGMIGNQPQQKFFPWYYFPLIMPVSDHAIVKNLNAVRLEFVSTVDTIPRPGIKKSALLHTSKYTKVLQTPLRVSLNTLRDEPDMRQFSSPHKMVGVLLEGQFESNFRNRIPPEIAGSSEIKYKETSSPTKMIVVGDGDVIRNQVQASTGNILPLGFDRYTNEIYGNKDFIMNAISYLLDESGLISVRTKEIKLRVLDQGKVTDGKQYWVLVNTLVPVLIIWLMGVLLYWLRKRKYAR